MGENTRTRKPETAATGQGPFKFQTPPWVDVLLRVCDTIYPFFLSVGVLLLFALLALVMLGRMEADWLATLISAYGFFMTIGFTAALFGRYDSAVPGWVGLVFGAACMFGGQLAIGYLAGRGGVPDETHYLSSFTSTFNNVGLYILVMSVMRLLLGYMLGYITNWEAGKSKRFVYMDTSTEGTEKPGLIPKCWQMSRCRPGVRMTCPNFIDRVPCWKRRSGCFCDKSLANYLMAAVDGGEAQEVIDMQKGESSAPSLAATRSHMKDAARRPWKAQKTLCHQCPLFLEHQEYKYKHLSWISFPITIGIVASLYSFFHMGYEWGAVQLQDLTERLIELGRIPPNFAPDASSLQGSFFEYFLLAVLTLLLTSYVIAITETAFLKWKI